VSRGYLAMFGLGRGDGAARLRARRQSEDYDLLEKQGIDVRGKVVIVRLLEPVQLRGFKALTAERRGAAAMLIYSDPAEDGYKKGPVFPDGPWGPETHLQRGSITYDFIVPGTRSRQDGRQTEGARRITPKRRSRCRRSWRR